MTKQRNPTKRSVNIEAKRWVVKLDDLTPMEQKRLGRWLKESNAHREAFEAAKREWHSLAFLQELRDDPVAKGDPWVARRRARRKASRGHVLPLAVVASVTATLLAIR